LREYLTRDELRTFGFEKIKRLQDVRFHATCAYQLPQVPFYKKLFTEHGVDPYALKTVEDWKRLGLPLIKKATYLKNPRDFITQPDPNHLFKNHLSYLKSLGEIDPAIALLLSTHKEKILKHYYNPKMLVFSGGTETGNPTPVMLTATQKFDILMPLLSIMGELSLSPAHLSHTTAMNLFPYAPHLGWHAVHHALDLSCDLNLCTAAGGAMPTERLVALAAQAQPNIICGMSDYLRNRFLPLAISKKINLPDTAYFITGAQKLLEPERQKIADLARKLGVLHCTVLDTYGASELKEAIMPECAPGSGFHHIAPLSTIIRTVAVHHASEETIDDWDFAENGIAASWNIDGAGSLLAGYVIGDTYERVTNTRCQNCGLNVTRIYNVNRIKEVAAQMKFTGIVEEKVKGTRVNLVAYRTLALSNPLVKEAQVVLTKNKIEIRYASDKPAEAKKELTAAFAASEIKPKLTSVAIDKLMGDKLKFEGIKIE